MVTTRPSLARRKAHDVTLLALTRDGRVEDEAAMGRILEAARSATDCFVFCHGWLASLAAPGRAGHARAIVAASAIGAIGARGVGAPELTLDEVQRVGLPRYPVVNVDGSAIVKTQEPVVGAHRDIHHREIATLILLAGGLLQGAPEGVRSSRLDPIARA